MGKDKDFLEEEKQNQPLNRLLSNVYQPGQQDARSMERIRQRLLSSNYSQTYTPQKPLYEYDQQKQSERNGIMNSQGSAAKTSQLHQWHRGLASIAIILTFAIIIGSLVLALYLIHRPSLVNQPTPTVIPPTSMITGKTTPTITSVIGQTTPTAPTLPHTPTSVASIHMIDSTTGWILCTDGSVLRTTDGGLNWVDETPAALVKLKQEHANAGSLFPDGSTAWIIVTVLINTPSANNLRPLVFHTSNAGQTWQEGTLPQNESNVTVGPRYQITTPSAQEAWVLDTRVKGASAIGGIWYEMVGLYHTTNGGKTWTRNSTLAQGGQYDYPPAFSFANQQTGIVTGNLITSQSPAGIVYLTHDGGASWRSIGVQSPDPSHWKLVALVSPQFVTPTDGIFTASFQSIAGTAGASSSLGFSVFRTHNGGQSWTGSPIVNIGTNSRVVNTSFFDIQQGYILVDVGLNGQLRVFTTSDGGQTWNSTDLNQLYQKASPNNEIDLPDFSTPTAGWALMILQPGTAQHYQTGLFATVNGGKTWTQVSTHFPSFITTKPAE